MASADQVDLIDREEPDEEREDIDNNSDFITEDKDHCCTFFGNCSRGDVVQFVLYVALFLGNLNSSLLLAVSRLTGHSQYLPSASLDPDTIASTPPLTEMSCNMGYIYGVVSCNIVFTIIMTKWVAQLNESSRWLRIEAFLNGICVMMLMATISLRVSGLLVWCGEVADRSSCFNQPHSCPPGWNNVTTCYSGLLFIKDNFGYNLETPFIYSVASLASSGFSLLVWMAVLVCVLSKFCTIWQRERMFQNNAFRGYDCGHQCDASCYHQPPPEMQAQYHGDLRRQQLQEAERVAEAQQADAERL